MKKHRMYYIRQSAAALTILLSAALCGCSSDKGVNGQVIVYNWGEYIDPETLLMFEEEYGIKVIYDEFETNESMYPKVESGAVAYDIACPSDYMISRMIQNGMLSEINYENIPNAKKISVLNTLSSPEGLIPKISTPSLTAGELWAFSITGRWWRNRSPAGNSFGMKNTQTIF